jgi:hypothetical protein
MATPYCFDARGGETSGVGGVIAKAMPIIFFRLKSDAWFDFLCRGKFRLYLNEYS